MTTKICRFCNQSINIDESQQGITWDLRQKGWYYHKECLDGLGQVDKLPSTPSEWENKIFALFSHELKVPYNYHLIATQIRKFLLEGLTYKGIFFTLYWHYVIKNQPYKEQFGIGLVPHIYKDSTNYWVEQERKQQGVMEQIIQLRAKSETARVVKPQPSKKKTQIESPF